VSAGPVLIGISGQIASGKSTLVENLAPLLGVTGLPEPDAANPYLERFYADPERWALQNLLFFFERSMHEQMGALKGQLGVLQERLPQEHVDVFGREFHAQGFLADHDMALAERLTTLVACTLVPPDLVLYLEIDPEEAFSRIKRRGHVGDDSITVGYLRGLARRYEAFIGSWHRCPVIRLDSMDLDVRAPEDVQAIAGSVLTQLPAERSALLGRPATSRP
jgi:deoxyadenosine/deoxycytidine kinase